MLKKVVGAAAAATVGVLATVAPATAMTATHGAYTQHTGPLSCKGQVLGDGDGGKLYVEVKGWEVRPSDQHFRTDKVVTTISAQEKNYYGHWRTVGTSQKFYGHLGPSNNNDSGTYSYSRFVWGYDESPVLWIKVKGYDDLFRAKVTTKVYDDEGARLATLTTTQGQCRL